MKYFKTIKALATTSPNLFRFGSVLVRGKNIISSSTNHDTKTHPLKAIMYPNRDYKGLHAEVALLRGYRRYDVEGSDVYILRLLRNGEVGMAKPCSKCEEYLRSMGIDRVFYTISETQTGILKLRYY